MRVERSNNTEISLIVPTRNEERIVGKNLELIYKYLANCNFQNFEILVSDHSNDNTPKIVRALSSRIPNIRYMFAEKRGIGAGIKAGIMSARYDSIMFYPIDMSWGLDCIANSFSVLLKNNADIVLGSREHAESICNRPLKRKIFSKFYNIIVNILFDLNVKDTQGTIVLRRSDILNFIDRLDSNNPTFQTQILIYAKRDGLKIIEIPVIVNDIRDDSKVSPIGDGIVMFKALIKEYSAFKKYK